MPRTKLHPKDLDENDLLTLVELHSRLGAGYHPRTVKRLIQKGKLIQGLHYFRTNGNTGLIKISLTAMKQYLIDINLR
ncbi:hypothetical protein [Nostoc sp. CHAB 5715]|uniref:hypothetical protein n=1 Tax=Nostoc sp. CHAB 5715 TaxID=2780400 RepID=UPI001E551353|nr:hypothetical protein [Nostoc sp. CHAB 5715]MCC5620804.1 hypothetical protein [Nostoc sp. CHAB 5715]